jgi:hypothetical protein
MQEGEGMNKEKAVPKELGDSEAIDLKVGQVWKSLNGNVVRFIDMMYGGAVAGRVWFLESNMKSMYVCDIEAFLKNYACYFVPSLDTIKFDDTEKLQFLASPIYPMSKLVDSLEFPAPKKMVKKSMAVGRRHRHPAMDYNLGYFASKEDADNLAVYREVELIMWPLVVNGVEQWIEVDE